MAYYEVGGLSAGLPVGRSGVCLVVCMWVCLWVGLWVCLDVCQSD